MRSVFDCLRVEFEFDDFRTPLPTIESRNPTLNRLISLRPNWKDVRIIRIHLSTILHLYNKFTTVKPWKNFPMFCPQYKWLSITFLIFFLTRPFTFDLCTFRIKAILLYTRVVSRYRWKLAARVHVTSGSWHSIVLQERVLEFSSVTEQSCSGTFLSHARGLLSVFVKSELPKRKLSTG